MKKVNNMKKSLFTSILFLIILGISSCKVGPNFESPDVFTSPHFRFDSLQNDTVVNLKWWEMFQDEKLQDLVKVALQENQNVLIAARRIEQARAYVGQKRADLFPSIGYEGGASRSTSMVRNSRVGPDNYYYLSPYISWEIDFWGKYRRATEAARAELLSTEYGMRNVMITLISDVVTTYFQLLDYDQRLDIARRTLDTRTAYRNIIQERYNKGYVPELDLNQAIIQQAIASGAVPRFERAVALTENTLSILLGRNPGPIENRNSLQDQVIPPPIPAGIPSELLRRRPDILQSEQEVAAQTAQIGVAQAMRFPSISLTGMLGIASADLTGITLGKNSIWSLSGGLLGPVFNFGKLKRQVEIERLKTKEATLHYETKVLKAFQEVENALVEIHTYKKEHQAVDRQKKAAKNAAYLSRERYNGGVTSYLEVLDSERTLFDAELSESETYQMQLNAYVSLYKALGGGWISREEENRDR
ncbi:MAG: efflux transporter outer membrane subunit [Bacteroidales bacterium]